MLYTFLTWSKGFLIILLSLNINFGNTYILSNIVDDHDLGVTHVIRGNDHTANALRQSAIYDALNWKPPEFAHIPLIYSPDG